MAATDFKTSVPMRTRWVDEDTQGVLNNAIYHTLIEEARLYYFGKKHLDLLPASLKFPFVLHSTNIRYLAPGLGGRDVFVDIKTVAVTASSFTQAYRIRDAETGKIWSTATAVLVSWDVDKKQKTKFSDQFRAKLTGFEGLPFEPAPKAAPRPKPIAATVKLGDSAEITKVFGPKETEEFAQLSEDFNPLHLDAEFAKTTRFKRPIVHGALHSSLVSALLGMRLPGEGTVYMSNFVKFLAPVFVGDKVTARLEVSKIHPEKPIVTLKSTIRNSQGKLVAEGEAVAMIPPHRIIRNAAAPVSKL